MGWGRLAGRDGFCHAATCRMVPQCLLWHFPYVLFALQGRLLVQVIAAELSPCRVVSWYK